MIKQKLCGYFKHVYADFNDGSILTKIDETDISFTPQYENCQILPIDNFPERDFMLKVNKGGYYKPFCPNSDLGYSDERTSRDIRAVDFFIRLKNKNDDGTIPLLNLTNGSDINVHLYLQEDSRGITRLMFKNLATGDIGTQDVWVYKYNQYINGDWTHVVIVIAHNKTCISMSLDAKEFAEFEGGQSGPDLEKIFTRAFTENDSLFLEFYDECELTDIITKGFKDSYNSDGIYSNELRYRSNVFQYPYISNVNIKYQSTKTPNNSYYKPIVAPLFGIVIDEMHCSPFDSVTTYKVSIHFIGMYKPKTYSVSWSNGKVGDTVTINAKNDFIWARVTDFNTGESNVSGLYLDKIIYPTLFYTDFWHNPTTAITNNTTYFRNTSKGVSYFTNLYDDNVNPSVGDLEKFVGDELYKDISFLTNPTTGKKDGYLYLPMSCGKKEINENTIDWYQKQKESFYTNNLLVNVNSADNNSPQNIGVFCHSYTSTYTDSWDFCFYASKPRDGMLIATIGRGKTGSVLDDTLKEQGVQIRLKPSTDQLMVVYFDTDNRTSLKKEIFYYNLNGAYNYNEENHFALYVKHDDSWVYFRLELFLFLNGKRFGSFTDSTDGIEPFFKKEIFSVNQKTYSDEVALSFENVHPFLGDKPNEQGFDYFDPLDYYRISKVRKLKAGVNRNISKTDKDLPYDAFFGSFKYDLDLATRGVTYRPAIDVELYPRYDNGNMFVKGIPHFEANDKLISEKETSDVEFGYSGQIIEKVKAKDFDNKYLPMTDVNMVSMNQKNITSNVPFYDNSSPYRSESELYRDFSFEFNLNKNLVSDTTGKIPVISLWTVNKRFISSSATNCSMKLAYDETENNYYIYSSLQDSDSYTIAELKQKFKGSKPFKINLEQWLKVDYINMCTKYQLSTAVTDEKSNAYDVCCVFVNDELVYSGRFYYYSTAEEQGANIGKDTTVNFLQTQYETGFGTDNSIVYSVRDLKLYPTTQSVVYVEALSYDL